MDSRSGSRDRKMADVRDPDPWGEERAAAIDLADRILTAWRGLHRCGWRNI